MWTQYCDRDSWAQRSSDGAGLLTTADTASVPWSGSGPHSSAGRMPAHAPKSLREDDDDDGTVSTRRRAGSSMAAV